MTEPKACALRPNILAGRSAHVVQDTPSYTAVASFSRGPAGVDAEMPLPNNVANGDLDSDPGFVRNCGRRSSFESEHYHPITIMPKRPFRSKSDIREIGEG